MSRKVSKYDIKWQMVRVKAKGKWVDMPGLKVHSAMEYFRAFRVEERKRRVMNWIEGIMISEKDPVHKAQYGVMLKELEEEPCWLVEEERVLNRFEDMMEYSEEDRLLLWRDLRKTNKRWLKAGYLHVECNEFLNNLFLSLAHNKRVYKQMCEMRDLRERSKEIPNTHRFPY